MIVWQVAVQLHSILKKKKQEHQQSIEEIEPGSIRLSHTFSLVLF